MNQNRTEWVMHVWGKKRETLELNDVEKFHIDMLKQYKEQIKSFDKILVNIALDDINDLVYRNDASLNYDIEDKLKNIVAKVLIIAINQDQYFPPKLDAIPMSHMIKNSELLIFDSINVHIGSRELIKIESDLKRFLNEFI